MSSIHIGYDYLSSSDFLFLSSFFFLFFIFFHFSRKILILPKKSRPQCLLSLLFYKWGKNQEMLHNPCMNKGVCKEGTKRSNFENCSICKPLSSSFLFLLHLVLVCDQQHALQNLCFPLFPFLLCSLHSMILHHLLHC